MSMLGQGLFYLSSAVAVAGALGTVLSKSAIRSALGLLATILGIAGLYLTLSAQLLAAVQLIVYAGAVVVLFVFVIMLLGAEGAVRSTSDRTRKSRIAGAGMFAVGALVALVMLLRAGAGLVRLGNEEAVSAHPPRASKPAPVAEFPHRFAPAPQELGTVAGLGGAVFQDGVVALELSGVLLLVAIVGVMAVARGNRRTSPPPGTLPKQPDTEEQPS